MSFNKISGQAALPGAPLPIALAPGETFLLPVGQGVIGSYGGVSYPTLGTNNPLSGQYFVQLGPYSTLQVWDSALYYWRNVQSSPQEVWELVSADATNFRIANSTGCPVGALITAAGSGGTNGFYGYNQQLQAVTIQNGVVTSGNTVFTITPSAGGSLWNAIVGGAVNTTISFSGTVYQSQGGILSPFGGTGAALTASAGSNYQRAPIIVFTPPPNQGAQPYLLPTAVCAISGGAISSVTVTQQGAGLLGLPGITVVPAPGDTTGGGAVLGWTAGNSGQVGSGTVTLAWPASYGTALSAVPTFTYGGTSNPAPSMTAIMNFAITSFTQTTAGVGYVAAGGAFQGGIVAGSAVYTNPAFDKGLAVPQFPTVNVAATTGLPSLAGPYGGSNMQAIPTFSAFSTGAAPSTAAVTTCVVGGQNDTCTLVSI